MSDLFPLPDETPEQQMRSLADFLRGLSAAGLSLTSDEVGAALGFIRRQACARVYRAHFAAELSAAAKNDAGRANAARLLVEWDRLAAEFIGDPPQIGAGQHQ